MRTSSPVARIIVAVAAVAVVGIGLGFGAGLVGSPSATPTAAAGPSESVTGTTGSPGTSPVASAAPSVVASAQPSPSGAPSPSPSVAPAGADPLLGTDGRLTVLLLGSDFRPSHPGNRTDAIMVVSVDPVSGQTGAVSIPRDLLNFPLPNGKVWGTKVNALYQHLKSTTKNGNAAMERAVAEALGVEVDGLVLIGFEGVRSLVSAVGGVSVTLKEPYYDSHYWVNGHTQGWGLSAGTHKLNAENALIFARTRKGDSDYGRAARQQQLVMAAVTKVSKKGPEILPQLLKIIARSVRTDLPRDKASEIFEIVSRANLAKAKRAVLGPRAYGNILGPSAYELNLKKVRAWITRNFPPITQGGTWPPAATPAPSPSGSAAP